MPAGTPVRCWRMDIAPLEHPREADVHREVARARRRKNVMREQSQGTGVPDPLAGTTPLLRYRDYKLPVKNELVSEPSQVRKFWKVTRHTARQLQLQVRKRPKPIEPRRRRVLYFDTPTFHLHRCGFILRQRTFLKDGIPVPSHELTLKFRQADYASVAAMDLRPAMPCTYALKFKEQAITEFGQMRGIRV